MSSARRWDLTRRICCYVALKQARSGHRLCDMLPWPDGGWPFQKGWRFQDYWEGGTEARELQPIANPLLGR